jgi:hypothetical protein
LALFATFSKPAFLPTGSQSNSTRHGRPRASTFRFPNPVHAPRYSAHPSQLVPVTTHPITSNRSRMWRRCITNIHGMLASIFGHVSRRFGWGNDSRGPSCMYVTSPPLPILIYPILTFTSSFLSTPIHFFSPSRQYRGDYHFVFHQARCWRDIVSLFTPGTANPRCDRFNVIVGLSVCLKYLGALVLRGQLLIRERFVIMIWGCLQGPRRCYGQASVAFKYKYGK